MSRVSDSFTLTLYQYCINWANRYQPRAPQPKWPHEILQIVVNIILIPLKWHFFQKNILETILPRFRFIFSQNLKCVISIQPRSPDINISSVFPLKQDVCSKFPFSKKLIYFLLDLTCHNVRTTNETIKQFKSAKK